MLATIEDQASELIALRHQLHQIPEVGLDLPQTGQVIHAQIKALGLECQTGKNITAFSAVLRGGKASPDINQRRIVLLRADMDGLPVQEKTGLPWASTNGNMHACGHDVHMSGLVGAMRALAAHKDQLCGDVVFMFQPGEESHDGARKMMAEKMLEVAGRLPDHAYGLHVWAGRYPAGYIGTRPGAMMASSDTCKIVVKGKGGHGSAPHETRDPIPVLAEIITQLQLMVTREFNAFDPVVITCGQVHAGTAPNVIPEEGWLEITIRAFSTESRNRVLERIQTLAQGIAQAHQQSADCHLQKLYPVTNNDPEEVQFASNVINQALPGRWALQETAMAAAEDFSVVLEQIPGCFIGVSAVEPGQDHTQLNFNHSAKARYSDAVVPDCAKVLAAIAYARLSSAGQ